MPLNLMWVSAVEVSLCEHIPMVRDLRSTLRIVFGDPRPFFSEGFRSFRMTLLRVLLPAR